MRILDWISRISENHKKEKKIRPRFKFTIEGYKEPKNLTDVTGIDLSNMEIFDLTKDEVDESK